MNAVEIVDGSAGNKGFVARRENIVRSRVVDMIGRLHVDLFLQDKFLINGVDVETRLVRSKSAFALMAGGGQPRLQDPHRQCHLVCKEGNHQCGRAGGTHQGSRDEHGQVSDALRPVQGVLHSHRRSVAHTREPVPRYPTETSGAVLYR